MDANTAGAGQPDDRQMFESIISDLNGPAIERAAALPEPVPAPIPAPATVPAVAEPAPHRTVRDAAAVWIDRRMRNARDDEGDGRITTGAFTATAIITTVVAGLAFALSFTMMLTAARHYGWSPQLAALFPLLIDVGAIGGTFMGAISANRVYRRIGHQVLLVTLSASVLFNLVGHSIAATPILDGLPAGWRWTGTAAAILVPALLAYFVHAFSKALKTFTDQRRAQRAATEAAQARRDAAERKRTERAERPARELEVVRPQPDRPSGTVKPKQGTPKLDRDTAIRLIRERLPEDATSGAVRKFLTEQGYQVDLTDRSLRRWISEARDPGQ